MHGRRCSRTIEARWFWPGHGPETLQIGTGNDPRCRLCYRGPPLPGELRAINPMSGAKRAAGDPCRTKSCFPQLGPHIRSRRRPERFGMGFVSRAARRRTQPTMPPPKRRLRKRDLQSPRDKQKAKGNLRGGRQRRSPRPFFALAPAEARAAKDTKCGLVTS